MQGVRRLLGAGIDSARLDAELLLGCALGMSREELIVAAAQMLGAPDLGDGVPATLLPAIDSLTAYTHGLWVASQGSQT